MVVVGLDARKSPTSWAFEEVVAVVERECVPCCNRLYLLQRQPWRVRVPFACPHVWSSRVVNLACQPVQFYVDWYACSHRLNRAVVSRAPDWSDRRGPVHYNACASLDRVRCHDSVAVLACLYLK